MANLSQMGHENFGRWLRDQEMVEEWTEEKIEKLMRGGNSAKVGRPGPWAGWAT